MGLRRKLFMSWPNNVIKDTKEIMNAEHSQHQNSHDRAIIFLSRLQINMENYKPDKDKSFCFFRSADCVRQSPAMNVLWHRRCKRYIQLCTR